MAIIPAYNEEKTIGDVLAVLRRSSQVDQVIVVSDGSEDRTVEEARAQEGVEVVDLLLNRGKGGAVKAGLDRSDGELVLILDADLLGLTDAHVATLLEPVQAGRVPMSIGIFEKGRVATAIAQKMAPFLSGQRALRRELLEDISDLDLSRFGIEVALHRQVEEQGIATEEVQLPDLSHVMKEEKLGFSRGLWARAKMYWEIIKYVLRIGPGPLR